MKSKQYVTIGIKLDVNLSLWSAIKLRIAGKDYYKFSEAMLLPTMRESVNDTIVEHGNKWLY